MTGTIVRGTTPTILFTFSKIDGRNLTTAFLTMVSNGRTVIEKDISTADVAQKTISWKLTQNETLSLPNTVTAQLNWKLPDGTRGASLKSQLRVEANNKEGVI